MTTGAVFLRWMGVDDVATVEEASLLFDTPVRAAWAQLFLHSAGHHLCLAWVDGEPAGFVSGVEMTHPNLGTEMFLYELGVDEAFRGRGIGRTLVEALASLAFDRGCYGMWVLTDDDNVAALATYRAAGASGASPQVMLEWRLD